MDTVRFKATDVFDFYKPSRCARRVALKAAGIEPQETDTAFNDLLINLGERHEKGHLESLPGVVDLSTRDQQARETRTLEAIAAGAAAIYQPRFRTEIDLDGEPCELVGEPDFLIRSTGGAGYVIRDSKLARNVLSSRHEGIPHQLQIYGFLFERVVGRPPAGLQVHAGSGELIAVDYAGEAAAIAVLREQRRMRAAPLDAYEPVGLTKCNGCGYGDRCRGQAEAAGDPALLSRVSQDRARDLHERGISISGLAAAVEDPAHRDYFYEGVRNPRHRDFVERLLLCAESYLSKRDIPIAAPSLPDPRNFAMFDLEGLPIYLDELEKAYIWGIKVFGDNPSAYRAAQAGFGPNGDREGWFAFLRLAERLFADYGPDLPFVHWGSYEKTKLERYIDRYGDPDAVAARVLANLTDLLTVTRSSVVVPLPGYGLKIIERHVGFRRRLTEADGAWSIASYIEATEAADTVTRDAVLGKILEYNEEDLDATWAVMQWLKRLSPPTQSD